jgi:hypothetical protein
MENELIELFDRFSFDYLVRLLLSEGFDSEDILNFIMCNCKISTLVYQERIENEYYKKISVDNSISDDLKELRQEIFNKYYPNKN